MPTNDTFRMENLGQCDIDIDTDTQANRPI